MRFLGFSLATLLAACPLAGAALADSDDSVFLWSATGGGWRSMFACVGVANVFQQAGLFSADSSKFRSIATNSGASWFATQMFYSQAFYNQTVMAQTPQELYDFATEWMSAYYDLTMDAQEYRENLLRKLLRSDVDVMEITQTLAEIELGINFTALFAGGKQFEYNPVLLVVELYDLYRYSDANWGKFIEDMMSRAAVKYGEPDFASIQANAANRILALQTTDMVLQTTVTSSSKVRLSSADYNITETVENYGDTNLTGEWAFLAPSYGELEEQDMAVYVGPLRAASPEEQDASISEDWRLFAPGLSAYYLVNDTYDGFQYATHGEDTTSTSTLSTYSSPTSFRFRWSDKEAFYLYPNDGFWDFPTNPAQSIHEATLQAAYNEMANNMTSTGRLQDPFGGAANVIQVAAVSSAAAAGGSPAVHPVLAQALSLMRQQIVDRLGPVKAIAALTAFDIAVQQIDESTLLDNFAVCSQWPDAPCGPADAYFLDGAYADNPSVASNIAQYQQSADYDPSKTIKLVIANTNQNFVNASYDTQQFTQYFATDFNVNVTPGDYIWPWATPILSPQVFEEYMSDDDLFSSLEPIEGFNHTTAVLKGTTIENVAFGTKAGQNVEILLINVNEDNITTFITGAQLVEALTDPIADMTYKLAADEELVRRVSAFFFGEGAMEDTLEDDLETNDEDTDMEVGKDTMEEDMEGAEDDPDTEGAEDTAEDDAGVEITKEGPLDKTGPEALQSSSATVGALRGTFAVLGAVASLLFHV